MLLQEHKSSGVSDSIALRRNARLSRSLVLKTITAIQLHVTAGLLSLAIALSTGDYNWNVLPSNTFEFYLCKFTYRKGRP